MMNSKLKYFFFNFPIAILLAFSLPLYLWVPELRETIFNGSVLTSFFVYLIYYLP